jgi:hypothetical protein
MHMATACKLAWSIVGCAHWLLHDNDCAAAGGYKALQNVGDSYTCRTRARCLLTHQRSLAAAMTC